MGKNKEKKVIIEQLFEKYKLEEAKEELEKYKIENACDFDIYSLEAIYYYLKRDFKEAENILKEALKRRKFNFDIYYNLANIYEVQGNRNLAFEYYQLAKMLVENGEQREYIDTALDCILKQVEILDIVEQQEQLQRYEGSLNQIKDSITNFCQGFPDKDLIAKKWNGYYLGLYNGMKYEALGVSLSGPDFSHKIEMFKVEEERSQYELGSYLIPVAAEKGGAELEIKRNEKIEKIRFRSPKVFSYFKLHDDDEMIENKDIVIGKPIPLRKTKELQDIVLTIFIDGLSQTVLEEYGLEELMPRTKTFFEEGVWCKNVYVTGEWTYPNLASFYTGQYTTKHQMFHPTKNTELPEEIELLSEVVKENGYMTAKIDADWRSVPSLGYYRGFDRILYQMPHKVMDAPSVIEELIEHIESFKETNQFIWTCIPELHDIADGYQGTISMQVHETLEEKPNNSTYEKSQSSVKQRYNNSKKGRYMRQIKRIDRYLGLLYSYLEQNFDMDRVTVALVSDHGQGYLVGNEEHMLSEGRVKVPFMFRGKGVPKGECEELIEGLDLMGILDKLVNPKTREIQGDMNLPVYFGGLNEREYTYSESIFPGDTYKASIHSKHIIGYYETEEKVQQDGSINMEEYSIKLVDKYGGNLVQNEEIKEKYLDIINDHMRYNRIYV